jgi:hypothetical protein
MGKPTEEAEVMANPCDVDTRLTRFEALHANRADPESPTYQRPELDSANEQIPTSGCRFDHQVVPQRVKDLAFDESQVTASPREASRGKVVAVPDQATSSNSLCPRDGLHGSTGDWRQEDAVEYAALRVGSPLLVGADASR